VRGCGAWVRRTGATPHRGNSKPSGSGSGGAPNGECVHEDIDDTAAAVGWLTGQHCLPPPPTTHHHPTHLRLVVGSTIAFSGWSTRCRNSSTRSWPTWRSGGAVATRGGGCVSAHKTSLHPPTSGSRAPRHAGMGGGGGWQTTVRPTPPPTAPTSQVGLQHREARQVGVHVAGGQSQHQVQASTKHIWSGAAARTARRSRHRKRACTNEWTTN
jgi:hypothetical protein